MWSFANFCVSQFSFLADFVLRRTACHGDYEVDIDRVCAAENRRYSWKAFQE